MVAAAVRRRGSTHRRGSDEDHQPPGVFLFDDRFFAASEDGRLFEVRFIGGTWVWRDHGRPPGGNAASSVSAAVGRRVYVATADGRLCSLYWDGDRWLWQDHDRPSGTYVTTSGAAAAGSSVFVTCTNGSMAELRPDLPGHVALGRPRSHPALPRRADLVAVPVGGGPTRWRHQRLGLHHQQPGGALGAEPGDRHLHVGPPRLPRRWAHRRRRSVLPELEALRHDAEGRPVGALPRVRRLAVGAPRSSDAGRGRQPVGSSDARVQAVRPRVGRRRGRAGLERQRLRLGLSRQAAQRRQRHRPTRRGRAGPHLLLCRLRRSPLGSRPTSATRGSGSTTASPRTAVARGPSPRSPPRRSDGHRGWRCSGRRSSPTSTTPPAPTGSTTGWVVTSASTAPSRAGGCPLVTPTRVRSSALRAAASASPSATSPAPAAPTSWCSPSSRPRVAATPATGSARTSTPTASQPGGSGRRACTRSSTPRHGGRHRAGRPRRRRSPRARHRVCRLRPGRRHPALLPRRLAPRPERQRQ